MTVGGSSRRPTPTPGQNRTGAGRRFPARPAGDPALDRHQIRPPEPWRGLRSRVPLSPLRFSTTPTTGHPSRSPDLQPKAAGAVLTTSVAAPRCRCSSRRPWRADDTEGEVNREGNSRCRGSNSGPTDGCQPAQTSARSNRSLPRINSASFPDLPVDGSDPGFLGLRYALGTSYYLGE